MVSELLELFPRSHEDRNRIKEIRELVPGEAASFRGAVTGEIQSFRHNGKVITRARVRDDTGGVFLTWFNQPYVKKNLVPGQKYIISGRVYEVRGRLEIAAPEMERICENPRTAGRILPVYPLSGKLTQKLLRNAVETAPYGNNRHSSGVHPPFGTEKLRALRQEFRHKKHPFPREHGEP